MLEACFITLAVNLVSDVLVKKKEEKKEEEENQITSWNFQKLLAWGSEDAWSLICAERSWKVRRECTVEVTVRKSSGWSSSGWSKSSSLGPKNWHIGGGVRDTGLLAMFSFLRNLLPFLYFRRRIRLRLFIYFLPRCFNQVSKERDK